MRNLFQSVYVEGSSLLLLSEVMLAEIHFLCADSGHDYVGAVTIRYDHKSNVGREHGNHRVLGTTRLSRQNPGMR